MAEQAKTKTQSKPRTDSSSTTKLHKSILEDYRAGRLTTDDAFAKTLTVLAGGKKDDVGY